MKRIITALTLAFALTALLFSLSSCDKDEITSEGLELELSGDGESYILVGIGSCDDEHIIIDTHRKKPITDIADGAFSGNGKIKSVTLGDTVERVGKYAFAACSSLESVSCGDSLEVIEANAFYSCDKLTTVELSDSVKKIGSYAFEYCKALRTVSFGAALETVESYAFYSCYSLSEAVFGDSLRTVGNSAFAHCRELERLSFGTGLHNIGDEAFADCVSLRTLDFAPAKLNIGKYSFRQCSSLRELNLPNGAMTLGYGAFSSCKSLESVSLGVTLYEIDGYAFSGCESLLEVYIPSNVTYIGEYTFYECTSLESLILPYIGNTESSSSAHLGNIFGGTNAENIPNTLGSVTVTGAKSIPSFAFDDCIWLEEVTLGNGVETVGGYAFDGCISLSKVTFADSVTTVGSYAFRGCTSLGSLGLGAGITSIDKNAFRDTVNLKRVNIADIEAWCSVSLYDASSSPFCHNASLYIRGARTPKLEIPSSVSSISAYAFYGANIESVVLHDGFESLGANTFGACQSLRYYEFGGASYLGTADNPYMFLVCVIDNTASSVTIHEDTRVIGRSAFYGCVGIEQVTIHGSVEIIGNYAFSGCTSLVSLELGDALRSIGYEAFANCPVLSLVSFSAREGWQVSRSSEMTDASELDTSLLSNAASAAELLSFEYASYYWEKVK